MRAVKIKSVKRKLALLLTTAMLFGMNMAAYASETQADVAGISTRLETEEFSFNRGLTADKVSVGRGGETAVKMKCQWVYNEDRYAPYSDRDGHSWYLGMESCTVSGNTCERTRIENRHDYSNTRYLVVDEEEEADELTITMECSNWHYWVKDKVTNELLRISGDNPETFTMTIKVGEEASDNTGDDAADTDEINGTGGTDNEENIYEQPSMEVFSNQVTGQDGKTIVSTVGGVYQASNVAGVAVLTPKEQVEAAVGIQASESGQNVRFYICNSINSTAKSALEQAVSQAGRNVVTTLNVDMYVISREGKVSKAGTASSKIRIVIGLPERCRNTGREYRIGMMGEDGIFYQLEDLDNDRGTITIETDKFGVMALME